MLLFVSTRNHSSIAEVWSGNVEWMPYATRKLILFVSDIFGCVISVEISFYVYLERENSCFEVEAFKFIDRIILIFLGRLKNWNQTTTGRRKVSVRTLSHLPQIHWINWELVVPVPLPPRPRPTLECPLLMPDPLLLLVYVTQLVIFCCVSRFLSTRFLLVWLNNIRKTQNAQLQNTLRKWMNKKSITWMFCNTNSRILSQKRENLMYQSRTWREGRGGEKLGSSVSVRDFFAFGS